MHNLKKIWSPCSTLQHILFRNIIEKHITIKFEVITSFSLWSSQFTIRERFFHFRNFPRYCFKICKRCRYSLLVFLPGHNKVSVIIPSLRVVDNIVTGCCLKTNTFRRRFLQTNTFRRRNGGCRFQSWKWTNQRHSWSICFRYNHCFEIAWLWVILCFSCFIMNSH